MFKWIRNNKKNEENDVFLHQKVDVSENIEKEPLLQRGKRNFRFPIIPDGISTSQNSTDQIDEHEDTPINTSYHEEIHIDISYKKECSSLFLQKEHVYKSQEPVQQSEIFTSQKKREQTLSPNQHTEKKPDKLSY